jgi:peptidyl-tRNA hydrolase
MVIVVRKDAKLTKRELAVHVSTSLIIAKLLFPRIHAF